ncbi:hypothetical protein [Flavobacterium sp.]|uniref:hypothetical protein n=1 Tax=Flavobacterium sp. TaxID=239 RepID=UPI003750AC3C
MKTVIQILIAILLSTSVKSQTYIKNFLGEGFLKYKGQKVIIDTNIKHPLSFTMCFYPSIKNFKEGYRYEILFPDEKGSIRTSKDSLKNNEYLLNNIFTIDSIEWNEKQRCSVLNNPIFELLNITTKQKIYYQYNCEYVDKFPFLIDLPIPQIKQEPCIEIEKEIDDFTKEIKFSSPLMVENSISPIIIYKHIKNGKSVYYLKLRTYGSTVNVNEKGVIILFQDGTKWARTEEIDVDANGGGFEYSAFITLTLADLNTFSTKQIKKFRLYIYDHEIDLEFADKFKSYVQCLKKSK